MEEERGWSFAAEASQGISKEQIMILECLFRQGIQTSSASQIQQITARLRDYGSIDENFIFTWFQNYRQCKNEESSANALQHTPPLPPYPLHRNNCRHLLFKSTQMDLYTTLHLQPGRASSVGNYQRQCPNIILEEATRKRHVSELHMLEMASNGNTSSASNGYVPPKTLQLFPLHPDGTLPSFARSENKRRVENEEDGKARMSTFFQLFDGRSY